MAAAAVLLLVACGGGGSDPAQPAAPVAVRVTIEQTGLLLPQTGAAAQLAASARDADDAPLSAAIGWSSSRPDVVQVDATGRVVAVAASGSAQIVARSGALVSAPLIVVVAAPAAGVLVLGDEQIVGDPVDTDPTSTTAPPAYRITLGTGVAMPAVGALIAGAGSKPVAGRVVALDGSSRQLTLEPVPLRTLLPGIRIDEAIDLSQAEVAVPADVAAAYEVRRNGATLEYVPRPGAAPAGRAQAQAAVGTRALPPYQSCETAITGTGEGAPLPLRLSAPPLFRVSLPTTVDYLDTPEAGFQKLVLRGNVNVKAEVGLGVTAAFEGRVECKAELGTLTVPIGGILAAAAGVQIPYGVGFELSGRLTVATMGIGAKAEVTGPVALGFDCTSAQGCGMTRSLELTPKLEPTSNGPSLGDLRLDVGLSAFGFATLEFGNRFFQRLRIKGVKAKFGPKLSGSFAPQAAQILDPAYQSDYKLTLEASAGLASDLGRILRGLGLTSLSVVELNVSSEVGRSPVGILRADRKQFTVGDRVQFKALLGAHEFVPGIGPYNIKRVTLVRDSGGARTTVGSIAAGSGQVEFDFAFDAPGPGSTSEFYAFVETTLLPFDFASLEVARAQVPDVQISVSPGNATMAQGATASFSAQVLGTPLTTVVWSASGGTITPEGLFTAPRQDTTVTVTATSVADPSISGFAVVTVGAGGGEWSGSVSVTSSYTYRRVATDPAGTRYDETVTSEAVRSYTVQGAENRNFTILSQSASGSVHETSVTIQSTVIGSCREEITMRVEANATTLGTEEEAARLFIERSGDGRYLLGYGPRHVAVTGQTRTRFDGTITPLAPGGCDLHPGVASSDTTAPLSASAGAGDLAGPQALGEVQANVFAGTATDARRDVREIGDQATVTVTWNLTRR